VVTQPFRFENRPTGSFLSVSTLLCFLNKEGTDFVMVFGGDPVHRHEIIPAAMPAGADGGDDFVQTAQRPGENTKESLWYRYCQSTLGSGFTWCSSMTRTAG